MPPIVLYHRTTDAATRAILSKGFRDTTRVIGGEELTGVWLSTFPLTNMEGAKGTELLEVTLESTVDEIWAHEVIETEKPYREMLFPAAILNGRARVRHLTIEEEQGIDESKCWNEYPPGEPERTFKELFKSEQARRLRTQAEIDQLKAEIRDLPKS